MKQKNLKYFKFNFVTYCTHLVFQKSIYLKSQALFHRMSKRFAKFLHYAFNVRDQNDERLQCDMWRDEQSVNYVIDNTRF